MCRWRTVPHWKLFILYEISKFFDQNWHTHINTLGSDSLVPLAAGFTTAIPRTSYFSALKLKVFLITVARQEPSGIEPPALINRQTFLNVGHWGSPTAASLRIDCCGSAAPIRANRFIFHGLLNRFPSVGGFPVELVYFIWNPMEISNIEEILLDPHLDALPFALSMDTEPTSGRWSKWILVLFMFSPLGMWRLIVLTSIYATDLWMEHIFPKRIIKIL